MSLLRFSPLLLLCAFLVDGGLRAQGATFHPVPGLSATAFVLTWHHGLDDDAPGESGLARALLQIRLERARAAVPKTRASGGHVGSDVTVAFVQVAASRWDAGRRFLEALLDDDAVVEDEVVELALARAALHADDGEWLYPGLVLRSRARRALCAGGAARGVAGSAMDLQSCSPAAARTALARDPALSLAVFGAVRESDRAALDALVAGRAPVARAARAGFRSVVEGDFFASPHPRVDAAFVAYAYPVAPEDRVGFAVGLQVARERAARRFRDAGRQLAGKAPVVWWSWLDADPLVVLSRRGSGGGDLTALRGELDAFVADLQQRPPTVEELQRARRALLAEISPLPWPAAVEAALVRVPDALPGRALAAVQAAHRGVERDAILDATVVSAYEALRRSLLTEPPWAGAVVPVEAPAGSIRRER